MTQSARTVASLVVLFACVAAAGFFGYDRKEEQAQFLASALKAQGIYGTVYVSGRPVRIDAGIVTAENGDHLEGKRALPALKLAYAKTISERTPLMALPGANTAALDGAVSALERLREDIANIQGTDDEAAQVRAALYPARYLRALAGAERARGLFIDEPSEEKYRAYEAALSEAFQAYRADSRAYERAFARLVPDTPRLFAVGGSLMSYERVLEVLNADQRAHDSIENEWRQRRACMSGRISSCSQGALDYPTLPETSKTAVSNAEFLEARDIIALYKRLVDAPARLVPSIPVFAISGSDCIRSGLAPLYIVNAATSSVEMLPYRKVVYVGDIRFIPSDTLTSVPFYDYFSKRGVIYIPTSPLLHYVCHDFNTDLSSVLATEDIRMLAADSPLSRVAPEEYVEELAALESALTYTKRYPLYEHDARRYLRIGGDLAQRALLPTDLARSVTDLLLAAQYGTAGFEDALTAMVEIDTGNARILQKGVPVDLEASYTFFFRSPYRFLFLSDNPSVHDGKVARPQFYDPLMRSDPYTYYSDLPHSNELRERIIRDMRIYRDIHIQEANIPIDESFSF